MQHDLGTPITDVVSLYERHPANGYFADKAIGPAPTQLEQSIKRLCERHGLTNLSICWSGALGGFWSVAAHRDHYVGHGTGATIAEAQDAAITDINRKCSLLGIEGQLPDAGE